MNPPYLLHIYLDGLLSSNYRICDSNKQQLYHVHVSNFSFSKPDLTLHAGTDKHAPVAAVAELSTFSSTIKVGLGNPKFNYRGVTWENMARASWGASKYQFEVNVRSRSDKGGERRTFVWKPTHHVGVGGSRPSRTPAMFHYKLVDQKTEAVVVVFEESLWAMEKRGKLEFRDDWGEEFYLMTLMTLLGILERKSSQRGSSAGGGAAGGC